MLTIPQHLLKIAEAIWVRIVIFTLSFLALEFGRMFITIGVKTHPHMTLWSGVLYEVTIVIVFGLLFGTRHVGRDINMLNCCAVFFYLVYMLFYYCGINVSEYHNWVATCINVKLTSELKKGNLNPGTGTKPIGQGLSEARHDSGARVYFREKDGAVEVLGKSGKDNQQTVIKEVLEVFGR